MESLFLIILKMSLNCCYIILFVFLIRLILKKAPKFFSYALWAIVFLKLICPLTFEGAVSLIPKQVSIQTIEDRVLPTASLVIGQGNKASTTTNQITVTAATAGQEAVRTNSILFYLSILWITGILILLIYSIISYLRLKKRLGTAIRIKNNLYETEEIDTPFVLGILRPRIYLPIKLTGEERAYILCHEQIHIQRRDYLIKIIVYFISCIHWFNPLVWLAFLLMNRDMEMSCDEKVIKKFGNNIKKEYSNSLLSLAVNNKLPSLLPIAFGENGVKGRIKNVLNYKKPTLWIILVCTILVITVITGLFFNLSGKKDSSINKDLPVNSNIENKDNESVISVVTPTVAPEADNNLQNDDGSQGDVSMQTDESSPKVSYLLSETSRNTAIEEAIKAEIDFISEDDIKSTRYYYNFFDLNDDGNLEIFVLLVGPYTSGSGGDTALIFTVTDGSLELIQRLTLVRNPVIISNTKTNGWRDLIMQQSGGGATTQLIKLKYDGSRYPNPSDAEPVTDEAQVEGIGIISNDIATEFQNGEGLYLESSITKEDRDAIEESISSLFTALENCDYEATQQYCTPQTYESYFSEEARSSGLITCSLNIAVQNNIPVQLTSIEAYVMDDVNGPNFDIAEETPTKNFVVSISFLDEQGNQETDSYYVAGVKIEDNWYVDGFATGY